MMSSSGLGACLARHCFVIPVCHCFYGYEGHLRCGERDSLVSVITDYRNLETRSFPIQQHSGGLYLMQATDFSINQSACMY
jgi:hypothetical protein